MKVFLVLGVFGALLTSCVTSHKVGEDISEKSHVVLLQYQTRACPECHSVPSPRGNKNGLSYQSGVFDGPYCQGFTMYEMRNDKKIISNQYVRLESKPSCKIDLAIPVNSCNSDQECQEKAKQVAESFLSVFQNEPAHNDVLLPKQVFAGAEDFGYWCRRRIRQKVYGKTLKEIESAQ